MNPVVCIKFMLLFLITQLCNTGFGQTSWRFAVLGDTHVGSSDTVAEMIPFMQADSVRCVLVCGDIAEGGLACSGVELQTQLTNWKTIFSPLYNQGIGVYPIRGNHEADAHNNINAWNTVFSGNYSLPQNGATEELNLTYSFTFKNALFIGLDNYVSLHMVNQNWLNQQLVANTAPHVFVFGHEAAFKVFHGDCLDDSVTARNVFWHSLSQAGVRAYFCGHDHFLDVASVDDGDLNPNNDVIQYLVGSGGGWLMDQYSNYNGTNGTYTPNRVYHDMEHGYALVEVSGEGTNDCQVTITWKKRTWNSLTSSYDYLPTSSIVQYSTCNSSEIDLKSNSSISLFPNPTSEFITLSGISGKAQIFDIYSKEIWTGDIADGSKINISNFKTGIYILKINKLTKRFAVVK
jgi:hypothetical protein